MATLLVWTPHARAQDPGGVNLPASEAQRLAQLNRWIQNVDNAKVRAAMEVERYVTYLANRGLPTTQRAVVESYKAARSSGATTAGMAVGTVTAIKGGATMAANGVVGFLTSSAAAGAGVAAAAGIAVGYGAVKAGIWSWAPCDHWITGGAPDCDQQDPVTPTDAQAVVGADYGYLVTTFYENGDLNRPHASFCYPTDIEPNGDIGKHWVVFYAEDGTVSGPSSQTADRCELGIQANEVYPLGSWVGMGVAPYSVSTNAAGDEPRDEDGDGARDYQWYGEVPDGFYDEIHGGGFEADRTLSTWARCLDPATGNTSEVTATTEAYAPGDEPLSPAVECPVGYPVVQDATVTRHVAGAPEDDQVVADYTAPDELTTPDAGDPLSACRTSGDCELMVYRGAVDPANRCDLADVVCLGWWQQMVDGTTDVYTCSWGGNLLPWTDCEPLANIDNPEAPQPGEDGAAGDPVAPGDLPGSVDNPVHLDDGCGVGLADFMNPLTGLAKGVGCALEWAFVPTSTQVETVMTDLEDGVMTRVPFAYLATVEPVITELPTLVGTECTGYIWDLTPEDTRPGYDSTRERYGEGHLAVPCDPPSWWDPVRGLLVAMVVVGTAWGLWNQVGAAVGGPRDGDTAGDF